MVRIEDGIHFVRRVDLSLLSRHLGRFVVDCVMDFGQEGGSGCCKPPTAAQLERPQMTTPVGGAQ